MNKCKVTELNQNIYAIFKYAVFLQNIISIKCMSVTCFLTPIYM